MPVKKTKFLSGEIYLKKSHSCQILKFEILHLKQRKLGRLTFYAKDVFLTYKYAEFAKSKN